MLPWRLINKHDAGCICYTTLSCNSLALYLSFFRSSSFFISRLLPNTHHSLVAPLSLQRAPFVVFFRKESASFIQHCISTHHSLSHRQLRIRWHIRPPSNSLCLIRIKRNSHSFSKSPWHPSSLSFPSF